jgi:hypothetical protein
MPEDEMVDVGDMTRLAPGDVTCPSGEAGPGRVLTPILARRLSSAPSAPLRTPLPARTTEMTQPSQARSRPNCTNERIVAPMTPLHQWAVPRSLRSANSSRTKPVLYSGPKHSDEERVRAQSTDETTCQLNSSV